jgi:enoyl-CoA hydratase/carnithine racemase
MDRYNPVSVTDFPTSTGHRNRLIVLQRPEKLNCLSLRMLDDLGSTLEGSPPDTLILAAAGRSFCTGLDLVEIGGPAGARAHLERLVSVYRKLLAMTIPTLALVRGFAAGGGAGLMACCATVIASAEARIRLPAGDLGPMASVVVPVFQWRAPDHTPAGGWLGCDFEAEEAQRLGLIDRLVSPAQIEALLHQVKHGEMVPKWTRPQRRDPAARVNAMGGLDTFLRHYRKENNSNP